MGRSVPDRPAVRTPDADAPGQTHNRSLQSLGKSTNPIRRSRVSSGRTTGTSYEESGRARRAGAGACLPPGVPHETARDVQWGPTWNMVGHTTNRETFKHMRHGSGDHVRIPQRHFSPLAPSARRARSALVRSAVGRRVYRFKGARRLGRSATRATRTARTRSLSYTLSLSLTTFTLTT